MACYTLITEEQSLCFHPLVSWAEWVIQLCRILDHVDFLQLSSLQKNLDLIWSPWFTQTISDEKVQLGFICNELFIYWVLGTRVLTDLINITFLWGDVLPNSLFWESVGKKDAACFVALAGFLDKVVRMLILVYNVLWIFIITCITVQ